jgi:hypothetical protein
MPGSVCWAISKIDAPRKLHLHQIAHQLFPNDFAIAGRPMVLTYADVVVRVDQHQTAAELTHEVVHVTCKKSVAGIGLLRLLDRRLQRHCDPFRLRTSTRIRLSFS